MYRKPLSDRLTEAMARTQRQWELHQAATSAAAAAGIVEPPAITIAISRQAGANGSTIARAIGERLHWPVYDRELLQMLAEKMGVRSSLLEELDERRTSWLRECIEAFAAVPTVSDSAYLHRLVETVLTLAAHGQCVIVGRGASRILPAATTLRVRLVAPQEHRITVVQKRRGIDVKEAARWVEDVDRARSNFVRDNFRVNPAEPENHDLILNTARLSADECADIVALALKGMQARTTASRSSAMALAGNA
jgi:cytidylate kinase